MRLSTSKFSHIPLCRSFRDGWPRCGQPISAIYKPLIMPLMFRSTLVYVVFVQCPSCRMLCSASHLYTPLKIYNTHPKQIMYIETRQLIASNNGDLYPIIVRERFTIGNTVRLSDNISRMVIHHSRNCCFNARTIFQLRCNLIKSLELRSAVVMQMYFVLRMIACCKSTLCFSL